MEILSDDILLIIGDYLDDHEDRYNAIFVNCRFNAAFSRVLHRSVTLKSRSQIQSFVKALMLHPHLIPVVRSLAVEDWRHEPEKPTLTRDELAMFSLWASRYSHSADEHLRWEEDLCLGQEEAWIALLLSLVNNIKSLKLLWQTSSQYLETMFVRATTHQKPFDTRPAFHRLEKLSLSWLDADDLAKGSFSDSQIRPFLRLPRLRRLSISSFVEYSPIIDREDEDENEDVEQDTSQMNSSPISELTLTSSNGAKGISKILASCPSLRSFKYQHTDEHDTNGFHPSAFYQTLSQHKNSLETIWLDNFGVHNAFTATGLNETSDGWFGSFADFTALKELRIRLPNLLDIPYTLEPTTALIEVLPPHVESLYIEGCKENMLGMLIRQLRSVLFARRSRFKVLRRVDVEGFFHVDDEALDASGTDGSAGGFERVIKPAVYEMAQPLKDACVDSGVHLFLHDRACLQTLVGE